MELAAVSDRGGVPGYTAADVERWAGEPAKSGGRSPFQRDRARVLHSAGLRRLGATTQVVGPGSDDFVRTRLTHTLEVAQIGRELGAALGCDPDLVDTGCLAHDLGHPPFGHNGEHALADAAAGCGGFEGNAQTLRILTRLEAKAVSTGPPAGRRSVGLNLTRASLDAAVKYPWGRGDGPDPASGKFGVYADDVAVFDWLRQGAPAGRCSLEAQVMDFADDVAYSCHDVEDAVATGSVRLGRLADAGERHAVWGVVREWYLAAADAELDAAYARLAGAPWWPRGDHGGDRRALAGLKQMTSELIGRFCGAALAATRDGFGTGPLRRYAAGLLVPRAQRVEIAILKGVVAHYVMRAAGRELELAHQREVIGELVALLVATPGALAASFRADFAAAADDAARLRVVVDQVASLTDASALSWHVRLSARRPVGSAR